MNIQEFENIVKQTLGLEGTAKEQSEGVTWFEFIQKNESSTVVDVTYYFGGKCKWTVDITRKLDEDEVKINKNNRWILSPDFEEGECLVVQLHGEGETLAEAVHAALFP